MDAHTHEPFEGTAPASVPLTENATVENLKNAVKVIYRDSHLAAVAAPDLAVYDIETREPLNVTSPIGSRGRSVETAVIVVVPKRTKRPPEDDVDEAAKRQKVGMDKENVAFAEPYQATAARLRDMDEVTEVVKGVSTVQQRAGDEQIPFIVLESSSGMGKTQMAFNLMARDDIDVFYIVCGVRGVNVQRVYRAFQTRSVVFDNCVVEDTKGMQSGDVFEIQAAGVLQTYGLICALLTGSETMDKKATREEVNVALIILSSTNGTARDLINYGQHSRGEEGKTLWCVVLPTFPSFRDPFLDRIRPDLRSIIQHSRPLFARKAVDFVKETESKESTAFDETADLVGFMDRMTAKLGRELARIKGNTPEFRCGQLRLFLAANYVYADSNALIDKHYARLREDKKFELSIPPGGKALYRQQPKAAHTMRALKREDSSRRSESNKLRDLVKNDEDWPWKCETKFPALDADTLLYLSLMGGKDLRETEKHQQRSAFQDEEGLPISFNCAINELESEGLEKLNYVSTAQTGNSGMRLEALTAGAIVSASHRNGFAGIAFMDFFRSLMYEFDMQTEIDVRVRFSDKVATLLSTLTVPFLAPPNQTLPAFLKKAKLNLGDIYRTVNKDMYDARFLGGKISVECKDYESRPISSDEMKGILIRVRDLAKYEPTVVRLVVTTKLQKKYFMRTKTTFMEALGGIPKELHHAHFYRIGIHDGTTTTDDQGDTWRDDLESIKGMENICRSNDCPKPCTRVEKVIIFVERWKTDEELPSDLQS
ncbi:hypothetical protein PF007_g29950 [Phytophthora fragariae]|uniref:Uncharacterized protein n=1 Tax=Phytophthora fragariae TaxID=53985 RepID=A0A6A3PKI7_9STRA|nr:hypothetical protein PF007_g29950 [Phytophthora fragariae]